MKHALLLSLCLAPAAEALAFGAPESKTRPVWAQSSSSAPEESREPEPRPQGPGAPADKRMVRFRPLLTFGLSYGGDDVGELKYTDGSSSSVRAGGLVQLGAGLLVDFPQHPLQLQTSLTYHVDNATASNAEVRFDRWPLEVLGFYKFPTPFRLGGGLQYAMRPGAMASLGSSDSSIRYGNALGFVAEGGYVSCGRWCASFNLRYTHVTYESREVTVNGRTTPAVGERLHGSHLAVNTWISF